MQEATLQAPVQKKASPPITQRISAEEVLRGDDVLATAVFRVTAHLEPGEYLVLVGSVPELGEWDPIKGCVMEWSEGDVWSTAVEFDALPVKVSLNE